MHYTSQVRSAKAFIHSLSSLGFLARKLIDSNLLPKERWLASFCQSEKAQRRRVLVYIRQTVTRDIQEPTETVLKDADLWAKRGDIEPALELLLIVLDHPASIQKTKDRASQHRLQLDVQLTPQEIEVV